VDCGFPNIFVTLWHDGVTPQWHLTITKIKTTFKVHRVSQISLSTRVLMTLGRKSANLLFVETKPELN
jgi:hypothetical protein